MACQYLACVHNLITFQIIINRYKYVMNLSLVFLVLTVFIAYLLYDMYKKSRQQQQLVQAQKNTATAPSRLKPSYQFECALLHRLHAEKLDGVKHKNVSIHLDEENGNIEVTSVQKEHVKGVVKQLAENYNVYLLVSRKKNMRNPLVAILREAGATQIEYDSTEGAVAVLRQLNCGTHLEGTLGLCNILLQYLPSVWLANASKHQSTHQFRSQIEMLLNLELSLKKKGKEE